MFSFSLLIDPPSVDMLVGPPSASEVIDDGLVLVHESNPMHSRRMPV
jgi:hypothetical protein